MTGRAGVQHRGRSTDFPADKSVRAQCVLHPGEDVRVAYEELVTEMGISGAEVLREALRVLHKREIRRKARQARQLAEGEMSQAG
ncbi:hypothetical protein WJ438_40775 (plasmid) [Streptomyces sp. GD-15H]|uniref:hypothetical protein n=1 Tax=Streptomyces sp. GD-15H TaxID=3129112 RepID=UPI003254C9BA